MWQGQQAVDVALSLRGGERRGKDLRMGCHPEVAHDRWPRQIADFAVVRDLLQESRRSFVTVGARVRGVEQDVDVNAEAHCRRVCMASYKASRSARSTRAAMGFESQRSGLVTAVRP